MRQESLQHIPDQVSWVFYVFFYYLVPRDVQPAMTCSTSRTFVSYLLELLVHIVKAQFQGNMKLETYFYLLESPVFYILVVRRKGPVLI